MKKVTVIIDGKKYKAEKGRPMLQVCTDNDIYIPHFCFHEDLPVDANCRTCLVETQGKRKMITTSCNLKAEEGLEIKTKTAKMERIRRENMELLLAEHRKYCPDCKRGYYCKTDEIMKKYKVTGTKYKRDHITEPSHKLGTAAEFDPKVCIACNKCVEMCQKIGVCHLKLEGNDSKTRVSYNKAPHNDCIYCGQCTVHCPVNAVREQSHIEGVEKAIKDKNKIVIVQTAPSVRTSIGEEFGASYGKNLIGKMATAYRLLGFDYVFDVNMGADITTWVEAEELVERIKSGKNLPMFTSCCPGWVKYAEFYHPEILNNLTTSRSPQIHSGGAYKTWWAEKMGIDPKKIVVVSVMPCTSKKYETHHEKLNIDGMKPVDYSLTTRELAVMLKRNKIDLLKLKASKIDEAGTHSGAAAIYGASGGVMESALRTAHERLTGKTLKKVEFKEVRGMKGVKTAKIKIGKKILNVAVAATAKNAAKVICELRKDPKKYDYIEVMACPGGCIGGGGQPIPSTEKIIEKRIAGLYKIDDKMKLRKAHKNPVVQEFMEYAEKLSKRKRKALLYTKYSKKKKFE